VQTETSVERAISLPENLNYEKVSASYENGVLTVKLPKREEVKPTTVAIEVK
jgi:HSP20 family protein